MISPTQFFPPVSYRRPLTPAGVATDGPPADPRQFYAGACLPHPPCSPNRVVFNAVDRPRFFSCWKVPGGGGVSRVPFGPPKLGKYLIFCFPHHHFWLSKPPSPLPRAPGGCALEPPPSRAPPLGVSLPLLPESRCFQDRWQPPLPLRHPSHNHS